jgi:hypothetical protein
MSDDLTKEQRSKRFHSEQSKIKRQVKIAKQHLMDVTSEHRFAKVHAMDCGNPDCHMCGNPRKLHKDKLTIQEKRFYQYIEEGADNGE